MSEDLICFYIVFAVFAIPGILCALLGCDPSFQPVCVNLQLEKGYCSHYKYATDTCSSCSSYSQSCNSNNECTDVCTAYVYFPCYSSYAFFTLPDYNNKTCSVPVDYQNSDFSATVADTESRYPLGYKKDFYIRISDDACVFTDSAAATAQAGLALSMIALLMLLGLIYQKRKTIFEKISVSWPFRTQPAQSPSYSSPSSNIEIVQFKEPPFDELEKGESFDVSSNLNLAAVPAVSAVPAVPMGPLVEASNQDQSCCVSFVENHGVDMFNGRLPDAENNLFTSAVVTECPPRII